jgi:hypothetical protein
MTEPVIHRVTTLDLKYEPWDWPFATRRRADIDAHFALKKREKPNIWNGQVLLARHPAWAAGRFNASYFATDFASFLAWRDWGFVDASVFNGFGMGAALRRRRLCHGRDGAAYIDRGPRLFSGRHAGSRRHRRRSRRHRRQRDA